MTTTTTAIPMSTINDLAGRLPAAGTSDVTIEIMSDDIGDQLLARHLPWHALRYDDTQEVLEVSVDRRDREIPEVLSHVIHHPTGVWLEETDGIVQAISIESRDGPRTLVTFHRVEAIDPG